MAEPTAWSDGKWHIVSTRRFYDSRQQPCPQHFSLCNGVVFRLLFYRHPDLLAVLINHLHHQAPSIRMERILNPSILLEDPLAGTLLVLDLLAEDQSGRRFGVEMQLQN